MEARLSSMFSHPFPRLTFNGKEMEIPQWVHYRHTSIANKRKRDKRQKKISETSYDIKRLDVKIHKGMTTVHSPVVSQNKKLERTNIFNQKELNKDLKIKINVCSAVRFC